MLTGSIFRGDGRATAAQHRPHTSTQANDCAARLLRFRDGPMTQNYNWTYISDDDGTSQKGFVTDASWCDAVENWEAAAELVKVLRIDPGRQWILALFLCQQLQECLAQRI